MAIEVIISVTQQKEGLREDVETGMLQGPPTDMLFPMVPINHPEENISLIYFYQKETGMRKSILHGIKLLCETSIS